MKFRSPTDSAIHIALTNGMTANVTPEGIELDPVFHREAISRGCVPETLTPDQVSQPKADPGFNRKETIVKTLKSMLDGSQDGDFNGNGVPNLAAVNKRLGFQASRSEVDAAWAEASKVEE